MADNGIVGRDPVVHRRSRWPWILGGLLALVAVVLGACLVLLDIDRQLDEDDVYVTDLTKGPDGFPEDSRGSAVRVFESGAYRMSVTGESGVVITGIQAPTQHLVMAIEVDVRPDTQPAGSEFGVMCWQGETRGYGFLIGADGDTRLVSMSGSGDLTTAASGEAAALAPGSIHSVMIACGVLGSSATLSGYIDGTKAISARVPDAAAHLDGGGMVGLAVSTERASWSVLRFERHGVHNMPAGWDG